jgi:hypothetical protein
MSYLKVKKLMTSYFIILLIIKHLHKIKSKSELS